MSRREMVAGSPWALHRRSADGDFSLLENTGSLHGFEGEEHVDEAALHVVDAGASSDVALSCRSGTRWTFQTPCPCGQ